MLLSSCSQNEEKVVEKIAEVVVTEVVVEKVAEVVVEKVEAALGCDKGSFPGAISGQTVIPQNWDCQDRLDYWFSDQGSQVIPYAWMLHLEQAKNTEKFVSIDNMNAYRYIPQGVSPMNLDALPIGFTKGTAKANQQYAAISNQWLGMTCAACHTGQIDYKSEKIVIEGAPAMADFEAMFDGLVGSMQATLDDDQKFYRFAKAVMADSIVRKDGGTDDKKVLRNQLKEITALRHEWNERNKGTEPYGHARLDAFGAILNQLASIVPADVRPADAPVSYPFIWDAPRHDRVQWNGIASNAGLGALSRNVGEVVGVFGSLKVHQGNVVATSINMKNLGTLESLSATLESPQWTDTQLPEIDQDLAKKGYADYAKYCVSCHQPLDRSDKNRRFKAQMFPVFNPKNPNDPEAIGTDVTMAKNVILRAGSLPSLRKVIGGAIVLSLLQEPEATLSTMKAGQTQEVIDLIDATAKKYSPLTQSNVKNFLGEIGAATPSPAIVPEQYANCDPAVAFGKKEMPLFCYKARPLNGIWATAPFLHNGSVRTMEQLLLPSACPKDANGDAVYQAGKCRQATFNVGSREYEPESMGFVDQGSFVFDTSKTPNLNTGHEGAIYGSDVFAADKSRVDALLEYIKTL